MNKNATIYERITNRLLDQMRSGTLPWLKPWNADANAVIGLPRNGTTSRPYSGINIIVLWASGFPDARWYTFNQARKLGACVRRGEKGQEVLFFKTVTRVNDDDEEREVPIARTFHVFNHSQIDWPEDGPSTPPPEAYVDAQTVLDGSGAVIIHGGEHAMYRPRLDVISLPRFERFESTERYFTTALHELVHWTGHKSRLGRELVGQDDVEGYAFEELVAELGAAFLAAQCGLPPDDRHHAAYLQSWIAVLEKDPGAFVRAASQARKASEFLMETAALEHAA
ncbi:MAG: zincin-like metallopeptidase domain-containing protein [Deltaproteobacteria bacterium]|jgi:antirestriction protein ArdC